MYVLLLLIGIYSFSFQGAVPLSESILGLHILRVDFFPFIMGFEERNNFVDTQNTVLFPCQSLF